MERLRVAVAIFEQLLIANGEERTAKRGKYGQLIVRPFHGGECGTKRLDLLAPVKRAPSYQ